MLFSIVADMVPAWCPVRRPRTANQASPNLAAGAYMVTFVDIDSSKTSFSEWHCTEQAAPFQLACCSVWFYHRLSKVARLGT